MGKDGGTDTVQLQLTSRAGLFVLLSISFLSSSISASVSASDNSPCMFLCQMKVNTGKAEPPSYSLAHLSCHQAGKPWVTCVLPSCPL